jgi:hypothetical protein
LSTSVILRRLTITVAMVIATAACSAAPAATVPPSATPAGALPTANATSVPVTAAPATAAPVTAAPVSAAPAPAAACAAWACTFNEVRPLFESQFGLVFAAPDSPHIGVRPDKKLDVYIAGKTDSSPITVIGFLTTDSTTVDAQITFAIRLVEPTNADTTLAWLQGQLTAAQAFWAANPDCAKYGMHSNGKACNGASVVKVFGSSQFTFEADGLVVDNQNTFSPKAISLEIRPA